MAYDIRPVAADEFEEFVRADAASFGYAGFDRSVVERQRVAFEADRSLAVFDGDRIVGTAGSFSFELTLPGGSTPPVAAVSYVSVLPSHRRRGLLSALMRCQLDDVRERGEPLAVLTASEGAIYGRFGYGVATMGAEHELERVRAGLRPDSPPPSGSTRLVDEDESAKLFPLIHEQWRRTQPGEVSRTAGFWEMVLQADPLEDRKGSWFRAVHEGPAGPDAYAIYRVEPSWDHEVAASHLFVDEMCALDAAAEAGLLSFLCGVDLVEHIHFENRPTDDPLRWLLADPRRLRTVRVRDWLWARPVDVAAALAARRYRVADRLVLEVADELCPWNHGRWVVEGGPDSASAEPAATADPDLALGPAELGAVLVGGVAPSALARAGRITERRAGVLERADLFFGTQRAPYTLTAF